jgi:hypothetical protein
VPYALFVPLPAGRPFPVEVLLYQNSMVNELVFGASVAFDAKLKYPDELVK